MIKPAHTNPLYSFFFTETEMTEQFRDVTLPPNATLRLATDLIEVANARSGLLTTGVFAVIQVHNKAVTIETYSNNIRSLVGIVIVKDNKVSRTPIKRRGSPP